MFRPTVSIVTPSLNQGSFIGETINSVLSQDYPYVEHIIVDGGSTDNTLEVLHTYGDKIIWISEPDSGQADAVNKGFRMAQGDILGWLNSDDTYNPGTVRAVFEYFTQHPQVVMVYGDAYFIDRDGRVTGKYSTEQYRYERLAESSFICQPTVFIRAEVFKRTGDLDVNLQTCMDYDYWIRIGKCYPATKIAYLKGKYLANSRMHSETKTFRMQERHYEESMETAKRHFGFVSDSWICSYINVLGVREQMKRYEKNNLIARAFIRLFFVAKVYGLRWGWRSFIISFKEGIKYFRNMFGYIG
jgi:glycosyltransferase involved in cell wall biosynthesis